jgi:hypothetical protein
LIAKDMDPDGDKWMIATVLSPSQGVLPQLS